MKQSTEWITHGKTTPFYARKRFFVKGKVQSAEAMVCGLGQFHFYLNGRKIGDHELDPGWTDYRKAVEYVTFDIRDALCEGENAAGFEVGNGWFLMGGEHYSFQFPSFMPPNPNPYRPFAPYLVLTFRLKIEYEDGSTELIGPVEETDHGPETDVLVCGHEVTQSNVYGSETIDARLRKDGFSCVGFDDSGFEKAFLVPEEFRPQGELIEQFQPPVRVIRQYEGTLLSVCGNRAVYDLSQNMSFILSLKASGHAGDVIRIYPAEKLTEDGDVDQMAKGWMMVDTCITLILGRDGEQEFRQKFTYTAGRYLAVEWDIPAERDPSACRILNVKADAVTSAWKQAGTWTSDDLRYNAIYSLVEKAVEANMLSVHTDCPTIERFAWQEPNHLMAPSIFFMKDGNALWRKFFFDMRMAQHVSSDRFRDFDGNEFCPGDGLIPSQAPCYIPNVLPVPGMGSFYDIVPWGSSIILGVRWHYMFYGDAAVIEENYDAGMRYLEHLKTRMTPDGFLNHGLGDWGNPDEEYARENVETAFLYADAAALAWFAEILGKNEDRKQLLAFADEVRERYNKELLVRDASGRWCYRSYDKRAEGIVTTQAVEALPLYFGMVPEEMKADVVHAFRLTLEKKQSFCAGEVGLPYIIQTAAAHGMNELVARFITKPEHPSYYAFVLDGETTLGEYWESNPRSHCHDMMGHIIEWYYNSLAGIQILEPGFGKIRIRPWLPEEMNELHCTYECPHGIIRIDAVRVDGELTCHYEAPSGVTVLE